MTDEEAALPGHRGYERATALFDERLGEEDERAWREHAPEDDYPSVEDGE